MSIKATISAASWRGYQSTTNQWTKIQRITGQFSPGIFALSGNGEYFVIRSSASQSSRRFIIYKFNGSIFEVDEDVIIPTEDIGSLTIRSIAIDETGSHLIIGATEFSTTPTDPGLVFVYKKQNNTWEIEQTIQPDDSPQETFGRFVAITDDASRLAVVSSPAVYIFTRNGTTWTQEQKLTSGRVNNPLGNPISINNAGDILVAGEIGQGQTVRVFARTGSVWSSQASISKPIEITTAAWGNYVSVSKNQPRIAIASATQTSNPPDTISGIGVYEFEQSSWQIKNVMLVPYVNRTFASFNELQVDANQNIVYTGGDGPATGVLPPGSPSFPQSSQAVAFVYTAGDLSTVLFTNVSSFTPAFTALIGVNNEGNLLVLRSSTTGIFIFKKT